MAPERQLSSRFILQPVLYGRRMSSVRALWVVGASLPIHTGHMAVDAQATTFVTETGGFIGTELVNVLRARGHQVFGLAQCAESAQRVRRAGAVPVMGDLLEPGQWQDEAAADWVLADAVFSNIRPRGIGFPIRYPTLDDGLRQVLGALHE
jgi:hypothetical protein